MADPVARILAQWRDERPELDPSPMGVFGRMSRLQRAHREASESRWSHLGINAAEFDVLATLRRAGRPYALTPSVLAQSTMVTTGGMTGRVSRLEQAGLVVREPDPRDGRSVRVRLTTDGLAVIDEALELHLAAGDELLAPLNGAERAKLDSLLAKLANEI